MTTTGNPFRNAARARARAIAVNDVAASVAPYFALTFLMSAMFVFMLMMGWAAGY
jgi:hypothetical protein